MTQNADGSGRRPGRRRAAAADVIRPGLALDGSGVSGAPLRDAAAADTRA